MLVLSRRKLQTIRIGQEDVELTVLEIRGTVESSRDDRARNWLSNTLSNRYFGDMDTIIRNVHDIDSEDRSALEHMLGRNLILSVPRSFVS